MQITPGSLDAILQTAVARECGAPSVLDQGCVKSLPHSCLVPGLGPHALRQASDPLGGPSNFNPVLEVLGAMSSLTLLLYWSGVGPEPRRFWNLSRAPSSLLYPSPAVLEGHFLRAHQFFHLKNNAHNVIDNLEENKEQKYP